MRKPEINQELVEAMKEICDSQCIADADFYYTLLSVITGNIKAVDLDESQAVFNELIEVNEIYNKDQKSVFFALMTLGRELLSRIRVQDYKDLN